MFFVALGHTITDTDPMMKRLEFTTHAARCAASISPIRALRTD
jgi:hypothetical protein